MDDISKTYGYLSKSELAGLHRLISSPDKYIGIRIYVSICGGMEHLIFRLMYVQLYLYLYLQRQVCACCLIICTPKRTLPVPDILSISIQIPYYTNVRKLCRYYNKFKSISFVMYNVESILLSSYVVWRNNLLTKTIYNKTYYFAF